MNAHVSKASSPASETSSFFQQALYLVVSLLSSTSFLYFCMTQIYRNKDVPTEHTLGARGARALFAKKGHHHARSLRRLKRHKITEPEPSHEYARVATYGSSGDSKEHRIVDGAGDERLHLIPELMTARKMMHFRCISRR